jgi:hypothetical protein
MPRYKSMDVQGKCENLWPTTNPIWADKDRSSLRLINHQAAKAYGRVEV